MKAYIKFSNFASAQEEMHRENAQLEYLDELQAKAVRDYGFDKLTERLTE